jgi:DNA mismatch repair protein MutL
LGKIKLLSAQIVNQIAAGEIIERPYAALKEVLENSIDANARNVNIFLKHSGKAKIVVEDDGDGLLYDDLSMCIQRHATSKLNGTNLFEIRSYGFRGEALPSIAAVSDLSIESNGFGISVNFSEISDIFPSKIARGTLVTIKNLFNRLPARLKFLKSDTAELSACISIIENFAIINDNINFTLRSEDRNVLSFQSESIENRLASIFGSEILERSVYCEESDDTVLVKGYLFHPIDSKYSQDFQRIFVNGRLVKDKIISMAIRDAYRDLIPSGRFAAAVLFIKIDPFYIDVNVSPTKSEVRFRDPKYVQKMVTNAIKRNLKKFDRIVLSDGGIFVSNDLNERNTEDSDTCLEPTVIDYLVDQDTLKTQFHNSSNSILSGISFEENIKTIPINSEFQSKTFENLDEVNFFGTPVCQIFNSYIITEMDDSIIIIDQHAVHEKITQMRIIKDLEIGRKQYLITPGKIKISEEQSRNFEEYEADLQNCGFDIILASNRKVLIITAIPSVLDERTATEFVKEVIETGEKLKLPDAVRRKIADIACHNSIRFGRKMSMIEMEVLLRQMAETDSIHQCNHHRPSFVKITKAQMETMFHRR